SGRHHLQATIAQDVVDVDVVAADPPSAVLAPPDDGPVELLGIAILVAERPALTTLVVVPVGVQHGRAFLTVADAELAPSLRQSEDVVLLTAGLSARVELDGRRRLGAVAGVVRQDVRRGLPAPGARRLEVDRRVACTGLVDDDPGRTPARAERASQRGPAIRAQDLHGLVAGVVPRREAAGVDPDPFGRARPDPEAGGLQRDPAALELTDHVHDAGVVEEDGTLRVVVTDVQPDGVRDGRAWELNHALDLGPVRRQRGELLRDELVRAVGQPGTD